MQSLYANLIQICTNQNTTSLESPSLPFSPRKMFVLLSLPIIIWTCIILLDCFLSQDWHFGWDITANHKFKLPAFLVISSDNGRHASIERTSDCQLMNRQVPPSYLNNVITLQNFTPIPQTILLPSSTPPWPFSCINNFNFMLQANLLIPSSNVMFVSTNFHWLL